jgi:hypothetical protein
MGVTWFKSSFSGTENTCVEIAHRPDAILMRDSKYTGSADEQPIVSVRQELWPAFLDLALSTTPATLEDVSISLHPSGGATITTGSTALVYDAAEWDTFTKGITDGQFDRPSTLPS